VSTASWISLAARSAHSRASSPNGIVAIGRASKRRGSFARPIIQRRTAGRTGGWHERAAAQLATPPPSTPPGTPPWLRRGYRPPPTVGAVRGRKTNRTLLRPLWCARLGRRSLRSTTLSEGAMKAVVRKSVRVQHRPAPRSNERRLVTQRRNSFPRMSWPKPVSPGLARYHFGHRRVRRLSCVSLSRS
jgi:hypothetical protein